MYHLDSYAFFRLLLVAILLGISYANKNVKVSPRFEIIQPEPGFSSNLGVTGGIRNCGGPGRVIQMRYEPCNGEHPCKSVGDGTSRRAELEFIPSADIPALGVRFNVITDNGVENRIDHPLSNSTVHAGQTYYSVGYGGAKSEMIGKLITIQWILYQVENNNVEVCVEADFLVVEPEEN